ncbi:PTS fructose transporter subunit IID [Coprothermobacter proteolyticus DSM 5265]|uniref:PTS system, fructose(Mannose)-specific IID n=1 Tax=Coprothermobacter proteolyticus (strain ATCC 35245 / DSM 5265 / OCM 4 / BT) TaxID=309798 RepID=B5Y9Q1_COPPD|nr:PTS system mannose/fructose/sorbose family transporter subunit IID [Coprothermobacter proteolyticus]ACI17382.1 PTS fructose transporter subunit IID [Coprothermobacter proteolyticus DSM 5265]
MSNGTDEVKKLSPKALFKSWLTWFFFNGSSQSGERMQGIAFCHSMLPIIDELWETKEEKVEALQRHMVLFNVEPQVGTVIHGITAAMEEQKANGADISDDAINAVKVALMGPLSAIGDTLVPGTLIPILLAIAIGITNVAGVAGPLFYAVVYIPVIALLSWYLFRLGYNAGLGGFQEILQSGQIETLTDALKMLGLLVMGALSASYVSLSTPLKFTSGEMVIELQNILDNIFPGLLSLGVVGLVWYLLSAKKKSPLWVMGFLVVLSFVGVLLHIF